MYNRNIHITLDASIDDHDQLVISADDESGTLELDPLDPLGALVSPHPDLDSLTLEVSDFHQHGALYRVHAATLAEDGKRVRAHWRPTELANGRVYTFTGVELDAAGQRIFIGATPVVDNVPVPHPFAPRPRMGTAAPGDPVPDPPGGDPVPK